MGSFLIQNAEFKMQNCFTPLRYTHKEAILVRNAECGTRNDLVSPCFTHKEIFFNAKCRMQNAKLLHSVTLHSQGFFKYDRL